MHETLHLLGLVGIEAYLNHFDKTDLVETVSIKSIEDRHPQFSEEIQKQQKWFKIFKGEAATKAYKELIKDMYVTHISLTKDADGSTVTGAELENIKAQIIEEIEKIAGVPFINKNVQNNNPSLINVYGYLSQGHYLIDNYQRLSNTGAEPFNYSLFEDAPVIESEGGIITKYPLLHRELMNPGGSIFDQVYLTQISLGILEDMGYLMNFPVSSDTNYYGDRVSDNSFKTINDTLLHPLKEISQLFISPKVKKSSTFEVASLLNMPDGNNGTNLPYDYGAGNTVKLNPRKKWNKTIFQETSNAFFPKIKIGPNGTHHVTYFNGTKLKYRSSTNGKTWSDEIDISSSLLFDTNFSNYISYRSYKLYDLKIGSNNVAYILFINSNKKIEMTSVNIDGTTTNKVFKLETTDNNNTFQFAMDLDLSNNIHIVSSDNYSIYYTRIENDTIVVNTTVAPFEQEKYNGYHMDIKIKNDGYPSIVYTDWNNGILYYGVYDGSAWSLSEIVTKGTYETTHWSNTRVFGYSLFMELDSNNKPHIIYLDNSDNVGGLVYATSDSQAPTDGNNWTFEFLSNLNDGFNLEHETFNYGELKIDSDGNIYAVFFTGQLKTSDSIADDTSGILYYARRIDNKWKISKIDYDDDKWNEYKIGLYVNMTLDSNKNVHLVYNNYHNDKIVYNALF